MDKYAVEFEAIYSYHNNKENPEKEFNSICCGEQRNLDTVHYQLVCMKCGKVDLNKETKIKYGFADRNTFFSYVNRYDRYKSFCKYIENKSALPNSLKKPLKKLFLKIQKPFKKICIDRKKFIMRNYVIIKLLQLLNEDTYIQYFKYPTTKITIKNYDSIWKEICTDLKWKFIPTQIYLRTVLNSQ